MTTLDTRLHGGVQTRNGLEITGHEINALKDVRTRLYAADTILRFAAKQPIVDISMRRRLDAIAGHMAMELSLLNAEFEGLGIGDE